MIFKVSDVRSLIKNSRLLCIFEHGKFVYKVYLKNGVNIYYFTCFHQLKHTNVCIKYRDEITFRYLIKNVHWNLVNNHDFLVDRIQYFQAMFHLKQYFSSEYATNLLVFSAWVKCWTWFIYYKNPILLNFVLLIIPY